MSSSNREGGICACPKPKRPNADLIRDEARSEAVRAEAAGQEPAARYRRTLSSEPTASRAGGFAFTISGWIFRGVVLAAVIVAILFLLPRIERFFTPDVNIDLPDSFSSLLPDETLGYSKIDFSEAILGESREKSDFVVLEQDITVTTRVSQALANLALFEKSQIVRSFGTGVYTVDLSGLTDAEIALDTDARLVTVSIPHAALSYVTVDVEKTEFEERKRRSSPSAKSSSPTSS